MEKTWLPVFGFWWHVLQQIHRFPHILQWKRRLKYFFCREALTTEKIEAEDGGELKSCNLPSAAAAAAEQNTRSLHCSTWFQHFSNQMFHFWTIVVNPLYAEGPIIIERLDQTTPFTIHWLLTDCYKIVSQNIWTRKFQIIFFWVLSCSWVEIALKRTRSGRCRCCDVGARHCPTSPTSSGPPPLPGRSGKQGSRHRLELAKNLPLKIFLFPH